MLLVVNWHPSQLNVCMSNHRGTFYIHMGRAACPKLAFVGLDACDPTHNQVHSQRKGHNERPQTGSKNPGPKAGPTRTQSSTQPGPKAHPTRTQPGPEEHTNAHKHEPHKPPEPPPASPYGNYGLEDRYPTCRYPETSAKGQALQTAGQSHIVNSRYGSN